jgi:hypothetical protein
LRERTLRERRLREVGLIAAAGRAAETTVRGVVVVEEEAV